MGLRARAFVCVPALAALVGCGLGVMGALELDGDGDGGASSSEGGTVGSGDGGDSSSKPDDANVDTSAKPGPDGSADADASAAAGDAGKDGSADGGADGGADAGCPTATLVDAGVLAVYPLTGVTVDGTLSEWGCVPFVSVDKNTAGIVGGSNPGGATLSAQFALGYDAQYLYFASKVTDTITGTSTSEPYLNDSVEIYLDGDGVLTGTYGTDDHQYIVDHKLFIRDYGPEPPVTPKNAAFTAAVTKPSGGWTLEARIAWTALGGSATVGRRLGFDVTFTNGNGSDQQQMLFWYYSSNTVSSCSGAGVCCGSGSFPYCDTRRFGFAELRP